MSPRRVLKQAQGVARLRLQPAQLLTVDTVLATYALVVMALLRSWDYVINPEQTGRGGAFAALLPVEQAAPLPVWGALYGTAGLLIMVGRWFRLHRPVWLGHALAACTYASMMLGILAAVTPAYVWIAYAVAAVVSYGIWRRTHRCRWIMVLLAVVSLVCGILGLASGHFFDGVRFGSVLILPTLMHWTMLLRMGWTPLDHTDRTATETVVRGPEDAVRG